MDEKRNLMGDMAVAVSLEKSVKDDTSTFDSKAHAIGRDEVLQAWQTMQKYKEGKANLEQRIIENQEWYKLRHWECMRKKNKEKADQVEPVSGWLFNAIANKHADAMDNYPSANILPREQGDKEEAKMLSSIIPVILAQNNFEQVYSNITDDKLEGGTGIYGILWDSSKLNGQGDITIKAVNVLNLFWEPGIEDIQDSRNVFYVTLRDNDLLEQEYPQMKSRLQGSGFAVSQYIYDDSVDTSDKSAVVDWYYKKVQNGRSVLHYCKFIAGQTEPLFATENERDYAESGWYADGQYPFVFDPMFRLKGTPCGFGYIDVAKSAQEYIDRSEQAIQKNLFSNVKPRYFSRTDGGINENEYADMTKDFVHVEGSIGEDNIRPITGAGLSGIYVTVLRDKIDELKETTGNRDVSTGGTTSGVTAASAIAAMMEAGSKLPRDSNKASFRAFCSVVLMIVERIRQFYNNTRYFRILGEDGGQEFVEYSNANIKPQAQGVMVDGQPMELGVNVGYRVPLFDITVTAQKSAVYSRLSQNELALQFYNSGFFFPQNADASLACLEMMDFDRKDFVMNRVASNGLLQQQLQAAQQLAVQIAQQADPSGQLARQVMMQLQGGMPMAPQIPQEETAEGSDALGDTRHEESGITRNARERVAASTEP